MRRGGRLPARSPRRDDERELRALVVQLVHERDRRCVGPKAGAPGPCWGPLDVDEACPRSSWRQGYLVVWNCQLLCRGHHDWKHEHNDDAVALGLRVVLDMMVKPTFSWVASRPGVGAIEFGHDDRAALDVARARVEPILPPLPEGEAWEWELVDRRDPEAIMAAAFGGG